MEVTPRPGNRLARWLLAWQRKRAVKAFLHSHEDPYYDRKHPIQRPEIGRNADGATTAAYEPRKSSPSLQQRSWNT
jgi:hypothetical protein